MHQSVVLCGYSKFLIESNNRIVSNYSIRFKISSNKPNIRLIQFKMKKTLFAQHYQSADPG